MAMHQSIGVVCELRSFWELRQPLPLRITQLLLGAFKPGVCHFVSFIAVWRLDVAVMVAPHDERTDCSNALETLAWPGIVPDGVARADDVVDGRHIIHDGLKDWQVRVYAGNQANSHTISLRSLTQMRVVSLLIVLGVDAWRLSEYCFVWVDGVPVFRDLLERCFQSDFIVECKRRRSYCWTA